AAGATERRRGDRFPLAAIGRGPDRVVHALQRHEPAAGVDYRGADLDVELPRLLDGAGDDAVGFFQRQTHGFLLCRAMCAAAMIARGRKNANAPRNSIRVPQVSWAYCRWRIATRLRRREIAACGWLPTGRPKERKRM